MEVYEAKVGEDCTTFVAGAFSDQAVLAGRVVNASEGGNDGFLVKVDRDGHASWVLLVGDSNAGGDQIGHVKPDSNGGAYFTGFVKDPDFGYTNVIGAVDADGVLRWTRGLDGEAIPTISPQGYPRALVQAPGRIDLVDIDAPSGQLITAMEVAFGSLEAAAEIQGRFGMLVAFNQSATLAGIPVERPGYAVAIVSVDANRNRGLLGVFDTPELQIWHASAAVAPNGEFAAALGFTGPFDFGNGVYVSPPLSDEQGLSVGLLGVDAEGGDPRTAAALSTGSMRAIAVTARPDREVRALFGISNAVTNVEGQDIGGGGAESRAYLDLLGDDHLAATPTQADGMWAQDDGSALTRTQEGSGADKTVTITWVTDQ
ncbi:MAG: hypothetical protein U0271_28455 [Polyangiaceae bacterium]